MSLAFANRYLFRKVGLALLIVLAAVALVAVFSGEARAERWYNFDYHDLEDGQNFDEMYTMYFDDAAVPAENILVNTLTIVKEGVYTELPTSSDLFERGGDPITEDHPSWSSGDISHIRLLSKGTYELTIPYAFPSSLFGIRTVPSNETNLKLISSGATAEKRLEMDYIRVNGKLTIAANSHFYFNNNYLTTVFEDGNAVTATTLEIENGVTLDAQGQTSSAQGNGIKVTTSMTARGVVTATGGSTTGGHYSGNGIYITSNSGTLDAYAEVTGNGGHDIGPGYDNSGNGIWVGGKLTSETGQIEGNGGTDTNGSGSGNGIRAGSLTSKSAKIIGKMGRDTDAATDGGKTKAGANSGNGIYVTGDITAGFDIEGTGDINTSGNNSGNGVWAVGDITATDTVDGIGGEGATAYNSGNGIRAANITASAAITGKGGDETEGANSGNGIWVSNKLTVKSTDGDGYGGIDSKAATSGNGVLIGVYNDTGSPQTAGSIVLANGSLNGYGHTESNGHNTGAAISAARRSNGIYCRGGFTMSREFEAGGTLKGVGGNNTAGSESGNGVYIFGGVGGSVKDQTNQVTDDLFGTIDGTGAQGCGGSQSGNGVFISGSVYASAPAVGIFPQIKGKASKNGAGDYDESATPAVIRTTNNSASGNGVYIGSGAQFSGLVENQGLIQGYGATGDITGSTSGNGVYIGSGGFSGDRVLIDGATNGGNTAAKAGTTYDSNSGNGVYIQGAIELNGVAQIKAHSSREKVASIPISNTSQTTPGGSNNGLFCGSTITLATEVRYSGQDTYIEATGGGGGDFTGNGNGVYAAGDIAVNSSAAAGFKSYIEATGGNGNAGDNSYNGIYTTGNITTNSLNAQNQSYIKAAGGNGDKGTPAIEEDPNADPPVVGVPAVPAVNSGTGSNNGVFAGGNITLTVNGAAQLSRFIIEASGGADGANHAEGNSYNGIRADSLICVDKLDVTGAYNRVKATAGAGSASSTSGSGVGYNASFCGVAVSDKIDVYLAGSTFEGPKMSGETDIAAAAGPNLMSTAEWKEWQGTGSHAGWASNPDVEQGARGESPMDVAFKVTSPLTAPSVAPSPVTAKPYYIYISLDANPVLPIVSTSYADKDIDLAASRQVGQLAASFVTDATITLRDKVPDDDLGLETDEAIAPSPIVRLGANNNICIIMRTKGTDTKPPTPENYFLKDIRFFFNGDDDSESDANYIKDITVDPNFDDRKLMLSDNAQLNAQTYTITLSREVKTIRIDPMQYFGNDDWLRNTPANHEFKVYPSGMVSSSAAFQDPNWNMFHNIEGTRNKVFYIRAYQKGTDDADNKYKDYTLNFQYDSEQASSFDVSAQAESRHTIKLTAGSNTGRDALKFQWYETDSAGNVIGEALTPATLGSAGGWQFVHGTGTSSLAANSTHYYLVHITGNGVDTWQPQMQNGTLNPVSAKTFMPPTVQGGDHDRTGVQTAKVSVTLSDVSGNFTYQWYRGTTPDFALTDAAMLKGPNSSGTATDTTKALYFTDETLPEDSTADAFYYNCRIVEVASKDEGQLAEALLVPAYRPDDTDDPGNGGLNIVGGRSAIRLTIPEGKTATTATTETYRIDSEGTGPFAWSVINPDENTGSNEASFKTESVQARSNTLSIGALSKGTYNFSVYVEDSSTPKKKTDTMDVRITVVDEDDGPPDDSDITVSPTTVDNKSGTSNSNFTLTARGGESPYNGWTIVGNGALAGKLEIKSNGNTSAEVTIKPGAGGIATGTYTATVTVIDDNGTSSDPQTIYIGINGPAVTPSPSSSISPSPSTSSKLTADSITIAGTPANNTMYVGDRITLTPTLASGLTRATSKWEYDTTYFSLSASGETATFTAKKAGTTQILYTVTDSTGATATKTINVTILPRVGLPQTGQDDRWPTLLLWVGAALLILAPFAERIKKKLLPLKKGK